MQALKRAWAALQLQLMLFNNYCIDRNLQGGQKN